MGPGRPGQVRHPVTYSATPVTHYAPPPALGEHDDAVRRWLTDLDSDAVATSHTIRTDPHEENS